MKTLALAALVMFGAAASIPQETVYKAGDKSVKQPQVVTEKKPSYTAEAMRAKIQGSIELESVIDTAGKATQIRVVRSLDKKYGLDDKAVEALKAWTFKPGTKDGKPVPIRVTVEMTFTLRNTK